MTDYPRKSALDIHNNNNGAACAQIATTQFTTN